MELRQLRYFVAVAEELHFRRAATRLNVSQPPLSLQIRQLEEELGCELLQRTRRRVELTPAGEAFLRDARAILHELDTAAETARRIDAGQTGRLRISFVGSALLSIVPVAVQRFRAARPDVEVVLRERPTVDQLRVVAGGAVDVGLIRPPIEQSEQLHVELTPAGEAFLRDARAILHELDTAAATARRIDAGQTGRLRISFVGSALLSIVPVAVQRFRAARPDVEVVLRERPTVDQLRVVAGGAVDVGLIRPPIEQSEQLHVEHVMREQTVAALPVDHPLSRLRRVPLARLAGEPLVLFPRAQAPGFHDLLISSLAATGAYVRVVQYAPEMLTILGLVAAGIGVSLAPASVAHLALDGIAFRPLVGAPHSELVAITRSSEEAPLAREFIEQTRARR